MIRIVCSHVRTHIIENGIMRCKRKFDFYKSHISNILLLVTGLVNGLVENLHKMIFSSPQKRMGESAALGI